MRSFGSLLRPCLAAVTVIITAAVHAGAPVEAVAAPPPVEAYAGPAMAADLTLSPDGSHVAYLAPLNGVAHLVITPLMRTEGVKPTVIPPGEFQFTGVDWVNNKTLVFYLIGRDRYNSNGLGRSTPVRFGRLGAVERDGSNLRVLYEPKFETGYYRSTNGSILQFVDDEHVIIAAPDGRTQIVGKLNVYTKKFDKIDRVRNRDLDFLPDPSGKLRLAFTRDDKRQTTRFLFRNDLNEEFQEISRTVLDQEDGFAPLGFTADDTLYVASDHENGRGAIYKFDLATRSFKEKVLSDPIYDADGAFVRRGAIKGFTYERDMPVRVWLDESIQKLQTAIDNAVPDSTEVIADQTKDGRFSLVISYDPIRPVSYLIYDRDTKQLDAFADTFPAIPQEYIGKREAINYKAQDGRTIYGYLTLPPNKAPQKLPFIVMPHGGPSARDDQTFDQLSQFLVSRGYAVLQPNFRGSTGYGRDHLEAGRGEWGGKMQTDVTDGVKWAIEKGIADPNRMCIVGWSYGGYSALMGAVQNSGFYKCAIAVAPVTNLPRLWKELPFTIFAGGTYSSRALFFQNEKGSLEAASPYHQADKIKIPVMVIHGDMDVQVLVEHAEDIVSAMKKNNTPHEYVFIKGMDHSPKNAQEMITVMSSWERFLAQHIGN